MAKAKTLVGLIAFRIGKVRCAQPPALVCWGSNKCDTFRFKFLIGGIDIRNTRGYKSM
jgi:hypothetical protein